MPQEHYVIMKNLKNFVAIIAISTILSSSAYATDNLIAVGPKLGTQGVGLEARTHLTGKFFGRAGINYAKYSKTLSKGNLPLKAKLTLLSAPIMLDWHPIDNSGFRISAGAAYNGNKLAAKAKVPSSVKLNGTTYNSSKLGSVSSKLNLGNKIAAIATLGYDNSFAKDTAFSFNCEAGIMFAGNPKLSVSNSGSDNEKLKADLKKDLDKSSATIKKYLRLYPVVSLGFKYNF